MDAPHPSGTPPLHWSCGLFTIPLTRPVIMGILNVTPDSFSDGGCWLEPAAAVARGRVLAAEGAGILDIGGESTRPGAEPPPLAEELRRVIPVIRALAQEVGLPLSVDTRQPAVAEAALQAGASIINDITALRDPAMLAVARASKAGVVLMHMQGAPRTMQADPHYDDVVAEVRAFLAGRLDAALAAGMARDRLVIDPGIGFGKTTAHNLALLGALEQLATLAPVLVGASRKRFIGEITGAPVAERLPGSLTVAVWSLLRGAAILRVHDVAATRAAITMAGALAGVRTA
jgi:dihydropteroate synthase